VLNAVVRWGACEIEMVHGEKALGVRR
jgi:hypothetical protein